MRFSSILPARSAFSLIEVTLSLGILAFCLIAVFGLLPVGFTSNQTSVEQTVATGMASAIVSDLRATAFATGTSANYKIAIPVNSPSATQQLRLREDGSLDTTGGANSKYLAYISFSKPASAKAATPVRILVIWPAGSNLNNNPPKNVAGFCETVTAIDWN